MIMEKFNSSAPESSDQRLERFREELAPIFDERFVTLGHGTRLDVAEQILERGLEMKSPMLQSTTIGLENSDEDMGKILNWGHNNAKAVVVVMIPKDARLSMERQEEIIDPNDDVNEYGNPWVLPPRFIKGYIDTERQQLILNPLFEENPSIRPRETKKRELVGRGEASSAAEIPVPPPSGVPDSDIF